LTLKNIKSITKYRYIVVFLAFLYILWLANKKTR